jgi:hypothetical protein
MSAALAPAAHARIAFRASGKTALNRRIAGAFERFGELDEDQIEAAVVARYRSFVAAGHDPADALLLSVRRPELAAA